MKKLSPLIILSLLLLSGCGVFGGGGSDNQANITPTPPQQPTPDGENQQENTEDEVIEENMGSTNSVPNALIPSTNPKERLNQISQGRGDPFGSIRPPAVVTVSASQPVPPSAVAKAILREPVSNVSEGANNAGNSNTASARNSQNPTLSKDGTPISGQKFDAEGNVIPYTSPEPKEAESIVISGIADLQGQNIAFVTTPWDNMTRSVRVGDTLSSQDSGVMIRVKDIRFTYPQTIALRDNNQIVYQNINDSNGIVVLEQYGQQITKEIVGVQQDPVESQG
ncbi:hypothetical protein H6G11_00455 [Cyanobacterium aponinum FACHB-4101]|uniref:hypothetical protein n=1 Tax=Cyanobacterium aponinum TaxID=379064 RepID=UPI001680E859|nr:hypothetical protein [Cyanobacterium aponinum]MBD2392728.1 hypothetical protein [Cyanobacterium aponinum FACHB-4101]